MKVFKLVGILVVLLAFSSELFAKQQSAKLVTVDNFVRAESDRYFKTYADLGGFGKVLNLRQPTSIDAQKVIRI